MPIPSKKPNEDKKKFISRCMGDGVMNTEYPDNSQRYAICVNKMKKKSKSSLLEQVCDCLEAELSYLDEDGEELSVSNFIIPKDSDYIDFDEPTEIIDIPVLAAYMYEDPTTGELYFFDMMKNYTKNGRVLVFVGKASEYQGKKVTLNKPFRTPDGPKKFSVYVKNDKGNVVKVNFGDPNMKIKKDIPSRRKSFRARMRCDSPGPKWKARYWACKSW